MSQTSSGCMVLLSSLFCVSYRFCFSFRIIALSEQSMFEVQVPVYFVPQKAMQIYNVHFRSSPGAGTARGTEYHTNATRSTVYQSSCIKYPSRSGVSLYCEMGCKIKSLMTFGSVSQDLDRAPF